MCHKIFKKINLLAFHNHGYKKLGIRKCDSQEICHLEENFDFLDKEIAGNLTTILGNMHFFEPCSQSIYSGGWLRMIIFPKI